MNSLARWPHLRLLQGSSLIAALLLSGCHSLPPAVEITGVAFEKQPLAQARVSLVDATGKQLLTETNHEGEFHFPPSALRGPLLLSVVSEGDAADCLQHRRLRPICMAALIEKPRAQQYASINPLSDRIVSDLAVTLGYRGPQQWVMSASLKGFQRAALQEARRHLQQGFAQALKEAGVDPIEEFDPATSSLRASPGVVELFTLLNHNRNYHNETGETGQTTLSDPGFRPLVGLANQQAYEPFDLVRARREAQAIRTAPRRLFILGDSTSAVYEQLRYPRMGWGQVFQAQFRADTEVLVVVASRAGRSSRDFYNGRWFAQIEPLIQPGDYVFINHGHNDQNCDSRRPLRGTADVENLCTYPNDGQGRPQYPAGHPERSFYYSLATYVRLARERGALPVLLTPTTRIKNAAGEQALPVVHSHVTHQSSSTGFAFVGDYSQTIRDLARDEEVPLLHLDPASVAFANQLGEPGWRRYWLVVDGQHYPYYAGGVPGSIQSPDGTHFQKAGAEAMANLVAELIRREARLAPLARQLKMP